MCGIAGLFRASGGIATEEMERMGRTLAHRGPDDCGVWIAPGGVAGLAHQRLTVIDLSALGHQPMSNEDGRYWLVYNGELYNFRELRASLESLGHKFLSRTDSEVVLHAY